MNYYIVTRYTTSMYPARCERREVRADDIYGAIGATGWMVSEIIAIELNTKVPF